MCREILGFVVVLQFFIAFANSYRIYNIETESRNLYHEDFKSVVQRFRRTPEYMEILQDKFSALDYAHKTAVTTIVMSHFLRKLNAKVRKVFLNSTVEGKDVKNENETLRHRSVNLLSKSKHRGKTKKVNDSLRNRSYKLFKSKHVGKTKKHRNIRMRAGNEAEEDVLDVVSLMEQYPHIHSRLTTTMKNNYTNIGYEMAGEAIHEMINSFNEEDDKISHSTRLPEPGQEVEPEEGTHEPVHVVTPEPEPAITESSVTEESVATSAMQRYRYTTHASTKGHKKKKT